MSDIRQLSISKAQQRLAMAQATLDHYIDLSNKNGCNGVMVERAAQAVMLRQDALNRVMIEARPETVLDALPLRRDDPMGTRPLYWGVK